MRRVPAGLVFALLLTGCGVYPFPYPDAPPVPPGTTVLVEDVARDDDDPIRARVLVVEVRQPWREVVTFYTDAFSARNGWRVSTDRPAGLCLVNERESDYVQVVEVRPYLRSGESQPAGRILVTSSRIEDPDEPCGGTDPWMPVDIPDR